MAKFNFKKLGQKVKWLVERYTQIDDVATGDTATKWKVWTMLQWEYLEKYIQGPLSHAVYLLAKEQVTSTYSKTGQTNAYYSEA